MSAITSLANHVFRPDTGPICRSAAELRGLHALVDALAGQHDRQGLTVTRLAEATGLPLTDARRLLERHRDCFVEVGSSSRFRLNPFGSGRADPERMKTDATRRFRTQFWMIVLVVVVALLGALFQVLVA